MYQVKIRLEGLLLALKQKAPFSPVQFLKSAGIGAGIGILSIIIILTLLAFFMTVRDVPHIMVEPLAATAAAAGGMIGGLTASRLLGEKGLVTGLLAGVAIFIPIVVFSFLAGCFKVGASISLKLATILLAAAVGGVMGVNTRKKRK